MNDLAKLYSPANIPNHLKFKHTILFRKMMADVHRAKAQEYNHNLEGNKNGNA
jgi:hypothetical protein